MKSIATPRRTANSQVARSRAAAMAAAHNLLVTDGWDAVTYVAVADSSGVGRTTLYRHWPTIEGLLHDVLVNDCVMNHPAPAGVTRLDLMEELDRFRVSLHDPTMERSMLTIMDRASISDEFARLCSGLHQDCSFALARIIRRARKNGELDGDLDIPRAVGELAGPLMYQRLLGRKSLTRDFVEHLVQDFLRAHSRPR